MIDTIFTNFDVILNVNIEKRERFDDIVDAKMTNEIDEFLDRFENVIDLDIENFVVVFDEIVVEIDEIVNKIVDEIVDKIVDEILSFSLLKFRFETLIIFFVA